MKNVKGKNSRMIGALSNKAENNIKILIIAKIVPIESDRPKAIFSPTLRLAC